MKPTIICLTPIKNEAWILDKFLQSTSIWADYIIVSDQMSTDGSREIANKYPKVILIENKEQKDFSEYGLRKPLLDEARKIEGPRLLISLDADEIFTPNFDSVEWQTLQNLPIGSIIKFPWLNIYPKFDYYWSIGSNIPVGYIDDGAEFKSGLIHACRLFDPDENTKNILITEEIKILHLQYIDWNRMESKHRWYQCFEKINYPEKSELDIYRQYHHMYSLPKNRFISVPQDWISVYSKYNIEITEVIYEDKLSWDEKILTYFQEYGKSHFRKLAIWDVNWIQKAKVWDKPNPQSFSDPRNFIDKIIQQWLQVTQNKLDKRTYRRIDRLIKLLFRY
jgi:hypothetical protein